jgi:hypothetical protein
MVNVTVVPASAAPAVKVGVNVVALAKLPEPLCVQRMEPRADVAPETVAEAKLQMVWVPPAEAAGSWSTLTVYVAVAVVGVQVLFEDTVIVRTTA